MSRTARPPRLHPTAGRRRLSPWWGCAVATVAGLGAIGMAVAAWFVQ
ncbi:MULTISPECIES: hypothetical protein [unclassified Microbacterium]|nr:MULTISPECIES: hypothetical protein [unclassified Microbacterium]QNA93573.1 hypothetical protein G4G29_17020 [Microbacterium sp. Se63.02b]QYM63830.1 hypothetical protein K1X59_17090 [Microbacterium sp. Se5.02b]